MGRHILAKDDGLKFARTTKKKKAVARAKVPEASIQAACEAFLDLRGIEYLHIPAYVLNAAFSGRTGIGGGQLWAMSAAVQYIRGFPDLLIFHPDRKRYLAVELKTEVGKLTDNQIKWQQGVGTVVCRSFEDFRIVFEKWMAEDS